jgi:hypothetical protein
MSNVQATACPFGGGWYSLLSDKAGRVLLGLERSAQLTTPLEQAEERRGRRRRIDEPPAGDLTVAVLESR